MQRTSGRWKKAMATTLAGLRERAPQPADTVSASGRASIDSSFEDNLAAIIFVDLLTDKRKGLPRQ